MSSWQNFWQRLKGQTWFTYSTGRIPVFSDLQLTPKPTESQLHLSTKSLSSELKCMELMVCRALTGQTRQASDDTPVPVWAYAAGFLFLVVTVRYQRPSTMNRIHICHICKPLYSTLMYRFVNKVYVKTKCEYMAQQSCIRTLNIYCK